MDITEKKKEILRLLAAGKRVKDIAKELGLAVGTISAHIRELKLLMKANTIPELACKAIIKGII